MKLDTTNQTNAAPMLPVQHVTIALFISYLFIIGTAGQNVTPRARSAAGAWSTPDGRLWLFGGQAFVNYTYMPLLNDLWRFSAETSAWDWIRGSNSPWAPTVPGTMGVPSASSDPGARYFSASWADFRGDLWLFGSSGYYNDLWRFRPSTNQWTWMDGSTLPNMIGVYNTPTIPDDTSYPGSRSNTAYAANPNGTLFYTFGGAGYNQVTSIFALPDLWRFNVETNQWTWLSGNSTGTNLGNNGTLGEASGGIPAGRKDAHLWASDDNLWLFGGYSQLVNFAITLNDLWHFDLSNYTWTWLGGYSGAGVYGQLGVATVSNWPGSRVGATYWTLGPALYLFGGEGYGQTIGSTEVLNDLWKYDTTTGMWTWLHGSKITKQTGSYDAGDSQYPGARKYASGWISRTNGLLYLFGGTGYASVQQSGNLNDLWVFNTSSNRWLWLTGSNVVNQVGDFCPSDAEINPVTLQGCTLLCGNNRTDSGEECQTGPGCVQCRCQSPYVIGDPSQSCTLCGNNQLDENEQCDGSSNCQNCTCIDGTVSVSGKCSTCGNGVIDAGEECDGGTGCLSTCVCDASQYYEAFNPAAAYCNKNEGAPWQIAVAVVIPSVVLIAGGFLGAFFYVKKLRRKHKKAFDNTYIEMANSFLNLPTALYIPFSTITIQEMIGEGSYGNVHIGQWNGTRVALKSPKKEYTSQFLEELRVMARIKPHDNLVRLYGYTIRDNETLYVVMEYCAQSSLDKLLYDTDQLISPDQKLLWIKQIASGLNHLHESQVIHRDIAARNILISNNVVKLSDFGMSREVTMDKGMTKSEVGPLRWMAPESIRDRVYSTKTDVWMFGCCAYEILVQHEPHTNADPIQVAIKIQNESLTPELPDTVDQNLAALLRVCWSPSPNDRPSMADVVGHLQERH